jgi:hypothetical protein
VAVNLGMILDDGLKKGLDYRDVLEEKWFDLVTEQVGIDRKRDECRTIVREGKSYPLWWADNYKDGIWILVNKSSVEMLTGCLSR